MEIVVMGCRGFGQVHLRSIEGVDLSIMERDASVAKECRDKFNIHRTFASIEDALGSDADVIDIVLPHNMHMEVAIKAMERGKDVIIEKPIARTPDEASRMISTAKKTGRKLMVAEQYHFDPVILKINEMIKEGKIGDLLTILIRDQTMHLNRAWRSDEKAMGGGALIDGGIHFVDAMLSIGGEYGRISSKVMKGGSSLQGEDTSLSLFDFKSGAAGFLFYSWSYAFPPKVPAIEVVGTSGNIYDDIDTRRSSSQDDPYGTSSFGNPILNGKKIELKRYDLFKKMFSSYIQYIDGKIDDPFSPEDALRDLKAVTQIYRSYGR
jgi:predicted dehydrogenase